MMNLASLFGKASPPLVGLDISTSGVRLVELADAGKGELRLERFASEPLPRGAVVDGNIENMEQVVDAVRRVWKKSGTRVKLAALGMPPASVITKKNHPAGRPVRRPARSAGRIRSEPVHPVRAR